MKKPRATWPGLFTSGARLRQRIQRQPRLQLKACPEGAEAPRVLAKYVAEVVEQELRILGDSGGKLPDQVALANRVLAALAQETPFNDKEVALNTQTHRMSTNNDRIR